MLEIVSLKKGSKAKSCSCGTVTRILPVFFIALSLRRIFGSMPFAIIYSRIRRFVSSDTRPFPESALDAVDGDISKALAISLILVFSITAPPKELLIFAFQIACSKAQMLA